MKTITSPTFLSNVMYYAVSLIEMLLGARVVLKFLGVSESAAFVTWVYATSAPLIAPFVKMIPTPKLQGAFVLEVNAIFAMIGFALLGYLLQELLDVLMTYSKERHK